MSTITYDTLGQVASRTDFGGNTTSYAYPPAADLRRAGLLDSVEYGSSTYTASYTYDGEARLVQLGK